MPIILKVTLVTNEVGDTVVGVNDFTEIDISGSDQLVYWRLGGNAETGSFHALDDPDQPGFAWQDPPANGVFGRPRLMENGDLRVGVRHKGTHSLGTFVYQMWVRVGTKHYSTDLAVARTATNPAIINK